MDDEAKRLRDVLRDLHDDLEASYPWAWTFEDTTIDDFQKAAQRLNDKIFAALYAANEKQQ